MGQIGIGAADCKHQAQHLVDVVTLVSGYLPLPLPGKDKYGGNLKNVHELVDQGASESEALVLARADLLVEHFAVHFVVATAGACAVSLSKRNEDQEVDNKASDYYLD